MIDEIKFSRLRAQLLAIDARIREMRRAFEIKYGSDFQKSWAPKSGVKTLEAYERAYSKAADQMYALLDSSPRNWRSGVPCHWVLLELSFGDAMKPLTETLSVVPPCPYGHTRPIK